MLRIISWLVTSAHTAAPEPAAAIRAAAPDSRHFHYSWLPFAVFSPRRRLYLIRQHMTPAFIIFASRDFLEIFQPARPPLFRWVSVSAFSWYLAIFAIFSFRIAIALLQALAFITHFIIYSLLITPLDYFLFRLLSFHFLIRLAETWFHSFHWYSFHYAYIFIFAAFIDRPFISFHFTAFTLVFQVTH